MGKPSRFIGYCINYIHCSPREVKHFSTWRNRKQCRASDDISLVAASEKETAQTDHKRCAQNLRIAFVIGVVRSERHLFIDEKSYKIFC